MEWQTDRQTDRQTYGQTDRRTDGLLQHCRAYTWMPAFMMSSRARAGKQGPSSPGRGDLCWFSSSSASCSPNTPSTSLTNSDDIRFCIQKGYHVNEALVDPSTTVQPCVWHRDNLVCGRADTCTDTDCTESFSFDQVLLYTICGQLPV